MASELRVGIVGYNFMGKAHSNAWLKAPKFFALPVNVVMRAACGRTREKVAAFADNWGWESVETDYRELVRREDIDLVDVCVPNRLHREVAVAALSAGKAVACEKPLAMNLAEAREMAKLAARKRLFTTVWYNYRRVPALCLARRLVEEGKIGRVFHVRAQYLQSWIIDPDFPLVWRLDGAVAGSGSHGDLNAHIIDAARFVTGEEVTEVSALMETFVKERPVLDDFGAGLSAKAAGRGRRAKVTVDDAVISLARLSGGGLATFEATRFAQGNLNGNKIEVNGEKGAVRFNFERMNELEYHNAAAPAHVRGWTTVLATDPGEHEYFGAWWPPGHIIGYEHTFIHQAADIARAFGATRPKPVSPDFADAARTQAVLEAMSRSAKSRRWEKVEIR
jgi:predicted dehydrogenase